MKNFKNLQIWQLGMDIVDKVYDIVVLLPQEEKYGMRSQIREVLFLFLLIDLKVVPSEVKRII